MTTITEPNWAAAKRRADEVRLANAELRREMKAMARVDALMLAASVLETPTGPQLALPLHRLLCMVPRFDKRTMRRMLVRAQIPTWDRRVRELTERQRLALATQMEDHAEGHWRG